MFVLFSHADEVEESGERPHTKSILAFLSVGFTRQTCYFKSFGISVSRGNWPLIRLGLSIINEIKKTRPVGIMGVFFQGVELQIESYVATFLSQIVPFFKSVHVCHNKYFIYHGTNVC